MVELDAGAEFITAMAPKAERVAGFLKGMANPQRLMILCRLAGGEMCVGDLVAATGIAPTSMSQHLARLREDDIVTMRREHRTLFYRIGHPAVQAMMDVLYEQFCKEEGDDG